MNQMTQHRYIDSLLYEGKAGLFEKIYEQYGAWGTSNVYTYALRIVIKEGKVVVPSMLWLYGFLLPDKEDSENRRLIPADYRSVTED